MNSRPPLEIFSLTDAGMSRSHNNDRHAADADAGFAIRADKPTAYSQQAILFKLAWQPDTPCCARCE